MAAKKINIKEFRESGYLQELNRRFLHPLGMALEVIINDDESEELGGILDYRDDPEGIYYDIRNSNNTRKENFKRNKDFVDRKLKEKQSKRIEALGFDIEPIE